MIYVFDEDGRHLSTRNAVTGETVLAFSYSDAGRLTEITNAFGQVTAIDRDAQGKPWRIVAPNGQITLLETDSNGYLTGLKMPSAEAGGATRDIAIAYKTGTGLLSSITGPREDAYSVDYDDNGRVNWADYPTDDEAAHPTTLAESTEEIQVPDSDGDLVDSSGPCVTMTSPEGVARSITTGTTEWGDKVYENTGGDGLVSRSTYACDASETHKSPDGSTLYLEKSPDPRLGMNAPYISYVKTQAGGLSSEITRDRTVDYTDLSNIDLYDFTQTDTTSIDGRVSVSSLAPSAATPGHWLRVVTTPMGRTASSEYNELGQAVLSQTPGIADVTYFYDNRGRLETVSQTPTSGDARTAAFAYDGAGCLRSVTDALGRQVVYTYDLADRLVSTSLPGGRTIGYGYDASSNLTSITPPGRPGYSYAYRLSNEVSAYTAPQGDSGDATHVTTYTYNLDRKLAGATLPDGSAIEYVRDTAGRVETVNVYDENAALERTVSNTFDANTGELTGVSDGTTAYEYTYDDGLLMATDISDGTRDWSLSTAYGTSFRVTDVTLSDGADEFPLAFSYDDDDQVTQVGLLAMTYDDDLGWLTEAAVTTGTTAVAAVFDPESANEFGEFEEVSHVWRDEEDEIETHLLDFDYAYDRLGRIETLGESDGAATNETERYIYDLAGRLRAVVNGDTGTTRTAFTFDSQGNRLTRTAYDEYGQIVSTESGAYNDLDQCTAWGDNTYTYDGNGSLTSKIGAAGTTEYVYDTDGNLLSVDPPSANDEIEYEIDALGNRIARKVNGITTNRWVYGGGISPLAEADPATGAVLRRYVYGTHTNVPDYMVDYSGASPEVYAFVHDHRGSVRRVMNVATGAVAQAIDYDESGRVLSDTNPGFQPFGFAGGLYDPLTGLTRFGLRDYDPIPGRWTAMDPAGFGGGMNLYGYVVGDPVNYFDPSGLGPDNSSNSSFWGDWGNNILDTLRRIGEGWGDFAMTGNPASLVNNSTNEMIREGGDDPYARYVSNMAQITSGLAIAGIGAIYAKDVTSWGVRKFFGKGGLLNSNRYLRIGFSRKGGTRVFRITGQWVKGGKYDLWKGGKL